MQKYSHQIDRRYNQHYSVNKKPYIIVTCLAVIAIIVLLSIAVAVTRRDYKNSQTLLVDQSSQETVISNSDTDASQTESGSGAQLGVSSKETQSASSDQATVEISDGYSVLNFTGQVDDWRLLLANRMNVVDNYTPSVKYIGSQYCQGNDNYQIDERVYDDLIAMIEAAKSDGVKLIAVSAYRSYEKQQSLYKNKVQYYLNQGYSQQGAENKAATIVAIPGTSDHNLGLAVDFNYLNQSDENKTELVWLLEHAEEYGFVMRYKKDKEGLTGVIYEPWHYRYVGKEHAQKMNQMNMCLEEYVQYLSKNS